MPVEVRSPISRPGSKAGSMQPLSPGARSDPGRGDQAPEPQQQRAEPDARRAKKPAAAPPEE